MKIHNVEQRSDDWYKLRVGKIGGSEAIGISTPARMKTTVMVKAAELLTGRQEEVFETEAMRRGREMEIEAINHYEMENMAKTYLAGYITNENLKYAGLSPDRLIGDVGALEVKCPSAKKHVEYTYLMLTETGFDVVPKEYKPQVAWYFFVNENLNWVDYMSFCPEVSSAPAAWAKVFREDVEDELKKLKSNYEKFESEVDIMVELIKNAKF